MVIIPLSGIFTGTFIIGQNLATRLVVVLYYTTILNIFLLEMNFGKSTI